MPCAFMSRTLEVNSKSRLKQGHVESCPSTTKTYLQFHNAYGHQTWQGGVLPWGAPTHKVTWPFDHVVLRDHLTKLKTLNLQDKNAYDHHILQNGNFPAHKILWHFDHMVLKDHVTTKTIISTLTQHLWPSNYGRSWLTLRDHHP